MMLSLVFVVAFLRRACPLSTYRQVVRLPRQESIFVLAESLAEGGVGGDVTARQCWPASRACARFVCEVLGDETVLELGCGLAAPCLAAAKKGASCLATDLDPGALRLAAAAADSQGLQLETMVFDLTDLTTPLPFANFYIFADVAADSRLADAVAQRVEEALVNNGIVLVAMQLDRAQRQPLWRDLTRTADTLSSDCYTGAASQVIEPTQRALLQRRRHNNKPALVLLDVDENDPSLY